MTVFPPADDKKPPTPSAGDDKKPSVSGLLDEADAGGKLEPIKAVLKDMGRDDIDAKEVLKLAQKDDRTHGKSPDEIASMLKGDDALLDDLMEYKDGGMFAQRGMGMKPGHSEAAEGEPPAGAEKKPGDGAPDFAM